MKFNWGHGTEKSFGNGIFRLSIKEVAVAILAVAAVIGGITTITTTLKQAIVGDVVVKLNSIEKDTDTIKTQTTALEEGVAKIEDRVLVLETIARSTRTRVRAIHNEEVFDPSVTNIKVKR